MDKPHSPVCTNDENTALTVDNSKHGYPSWPQMLVVTFKSLRWLAYRGLKEPGSIIFLSVICLTCKRMNHLWHSCYHSGKHKHKMDKEWWYRCKKMRRRRNILVLQRPPAVSGCISKFFVGHQRRGKVKELQWLLGVPVMAEAFRRRRRLRTALLALFFIFQFLNQPTLKHQK